ncbi:MAG: hypothetical protein GKC02_10195 [Methanomassiliicoccales archaeon]|nr:hypothetical protein [Methanomassiliicoccales archaeon]
MFDEFDVRQFLCHLFCPKMTFISPPQILNDTKVQDCHPQLWLYNSIFKRSRGRDKRKDCYCDRQEG